MNPLPPPTFQFDDATDANASPPASPIFTFDSARIPTPTLHDLDEFPSRTGRSPSLVSILSQPDNDALYGVMRAEWTRLKQNASEDVSEFVASCNGDTPCPRAQMLADFVREREEDLNLAAELGMAVLRKLEESQIALEELQEVHEVYRNRLEALEGQSDIELEDIEYLRNDRLNLEFRNSDMKEQLEKSDIRMCELMDTIEAKNQDLDKLQKQLTKLSLYKSENERLELKIETLQAEIVSWEEEDNLKSQKLKKSLARVNELEDLYEKSKDEIVLLKETQTRIEGSRREHRRVRIVVAGEEKPPPQLGEVFELVKELTASNVSLNNQNLQLRAENKSIRELLNDSRNELVQLKGAVEEAENRSRAPSVFNETIGEEIRGKSVFEELESYVISTSLKKLQSRSPIIRAEMSKLETPEESNLIPDCISETNISIFSAESEITTTSKKPTNLRSPPRLKHRSSHGSLSNIPSSTAIYIRMLTSISNEIHHRLFRTDTVLLNRLLRRSFELPELVALSDSLIDNIFTDIANMAKRFPPAHPKREAGEDAATLVGPVVLLAQA
ncbi:hypothetical protein HK096_007050, partial [Nowakowskiella sp. JEL0078]